MRFGLAELDCELVSETRTRHSGFLKKPANVVNCEWPLVIQRQISSTDICLSLWQHLLRRRATLVFHLPHCTPHHHLSAIRLMIWFWFENKIRLLRERKWLQEERVTPWLVRPRNGSFEVTSLEYTTEIIVTVREVLIRIKTKKLVSSTSAPLWCLCLLCGLHYTRTCSIPFQTDYEQLPATWNWRIYQKPCHFCFSSSQTCFKIFRKVGDGIDEALKNLADKFVFVLFILWFKAIMYNFAILWGSKASM